jgi:hypothetical protein
VLPNLYEIIHDLDGRLLPFNWMKFAWRVWKGSYRSARIVLMGTRFDLRHTVLGALLPMLIIEELVRRAQRYSLAEIEVGWILEDNVGVRSLIEAHGALPTKRYRIFEKDLSAAAPDS